MKKRRSLPTKASGVSSLFVGILINLCTYVLSALIFSVIAYTQSDPLGLEKAFSLVALLLCGAISGFAVAKKSEKAYTATLASLAFALCLLLIGIITSGGVPRVGKIVNLAIFVAVSALTSKLASLKPSKKRFRR